LRLLAVLIDLLAVLGASRGGFGVWSPMLAFADSLVLTLSRTQPFFRAIEKD